MWRLIKENKYKQEKANHLKNRVIFKLAANLNHDRSV